MKKQYPSCAVLAATIALIASGNPFAQTFTRITTGTIARDIGESVALAWGDYNNDGYEDLFVGNTAGKNDYLYLNNGDGSFTRILAGDIVNDGTDSSSAVWGDFDNDGFLDLMVTVNTFPTARSNLLYRNAGNGTFIKVNSGSIVTDINLGMATAAWGDYDGDGHIDMFIANDGFTSDVQRKDFLYRNNGDGGFTRILSGPMVNDSGRSQAGTWVDYNNDGKPDLFVVNIPQNDQGKSFLYRNDGNGIFTRIIGGDIVNEGGYGAGASWGDYDNNGFPDVFVARGGAFEAASNRLYRNTGTGDFDKITTGAIVTDTARFSGSVWGDFDNDGFLDLFVTEYQPGSNYLYHNNGDGTFSRVTTGVLVNDRGDSTLSAVADYDNNGFLDIVVANINGQANFLYHNDGNSNQWLKVKCVGGPSNRAAIGAKVRVETLNGFGESGWQMREISGGNGYAQNSLIAHFGLAAATNALTVRVEWPSGIVQTLTNVAAKQLLTITEPPLLQATLMNGSFELRVTGGIGVAYGVEASVDLVGWSAIGNVTNTARTVPFHVPGPANPQRRFFRAVSR